MEIAEIEEKLKEHVLKIFSIARMNPKQNAGKSTGDAACPISENNI